VSEAILQDTFYKFVFLNFKSSDSLSLSRKGLSLLNLFHVLGPRLRACRPAIKDLLVLFRSLMLRMPSNFHEFYPVLIIALGVINTLRISTTIIDDEINATCDEVKKNLDELIEEEKKKRAEGNDQRKVQKKAERRPREDFRDMSIFPDVATDLHTRTVFLRENKIYGAYEDVQHYLDVQFRLLREDFVQPLRNGIQEYQYLHEEVGPGAKSHRLTDVRVYHDVNVLNPICTHSGIHYRIRFDVSRMKHVSGSLSSSF